jgi:hypothetical protein
MIRIEHAIAVIIVIAFFFGIAAGIAERHKAAKQAKANALKEAARRQKAEAERIP